MIVNMQVTTGGGGRQGLTFGYAVHVNLDWHACRLTMISLLAGGGAYVCGERPHAHHSPDCGPWGGCEGAVHGPCGGGTGQSPRLPRGDYPQNPRAVPPWSL